MNIPASVLKNMQSVSKVKTITIPLVPYCYDEFEAKVTRRVPGVLLGDVLLGEEFAEFVWYNVPCGFARGLYRRLRKLNGRDL